MSCFERTVLAGVGMSLLVSATLSFARGEEEFRRRAGLKGTHILKDREGRNIEYSFSKCSRESRPLLLLENGLGSPLESWDWVEYLLKDDFNILRYHRRGYARTKSRQTPAAIVERLLEVVAPDGPVVIAGHSMGALIAANMILGSRTIASRTNAVIVVDGTDAELLDEDRRVPQRVGRFKQLAIQESIAQILGVNRWVPNKFERDVEYRPDVQRAFVAATTSVRTQVASVREYLTEPTRGQDALRSARTPVRVISASDNVPQQRTLAAKLEAEFSVVPESSHRSIIGRLPHAAVVAQVIREASPQ